jgi:phage baseplate assembly protein V
MILRGVIRRVDDAPKCQTVQASARSGEDLEGERFQEFGLTSVPPVGTEAIAVQIAGTYDTEVIVATESREHRPRNMAAGDVVLYDAHGHQIRLVSSAIELGSGASKGVARTGDAVASTTVEDAAFWTWITAVTAYVNGLAPGTLTPIASLTGKVTAGSGVVKAVD